MDKKERNKTETYAFAMGATFWGGFSAAVFRIVMTFWGVETAGYVTTIFVLLPMVYVLIKIGKGDFR